jgi:predicted DNA-binding transcriptional regulator AlpA
MPRQGNTQCEVLSGWKEIANYLGMGVRTVQRYEREQGLPIRRPAGRSTGSVIATKAEIDAWISASPLREPFRLSLHAVGSTETG